MKRMGGEGVNLTEGEILIALHPDTKLWSRKFVRAKLGTNEAKLRQIITIGHLRPNPLTGNFARKLVEAYECKLEQESLNGNMAQDKTEMAGDGGDWGRPSLPLGAQNAGGNGKIRRVG